MGKRLKKRRSSKREKKKKKHKEEKEEVRKYKIKKIKGKYYLPCKVCKEFILVGDASVMGVVCGDCITLDPRGVARVRAGRSIMRLTDARRVLEDNDTYEKRQKREQGRKEKEKKQRQEDRKELRKLKRTFTYYVRKYHDKKVRKLRKKKDRELEKKDRKKNKKKRSRKKFYTWRVEYDGKRKKITFDDKKSERQVTKYYKQKGKKLSFIKRIKES